MDLVEVEKIAISLIREHLSSQWTFKFNSRLQTTFGRCYKRKKTIELNPRLCEVNSIDHVIDTVLHEIAHGLCRSRKSHGAAWKGIARRLGAIPKRCYDDTVVDYRRSTG